MEIDIKTLIEAGEKETKPKHADIIQGIPALERITDIIKKDMDGDVIFYTTRDDIIKARELDEQRRKSRGHIKIL